MPINVVFFSRTDVRGVYIYIYSTQTLSITVPFVSRLFPTSFIAVFDQTILRTTTHSDDDGSSLHVPGRVYVRRVVRRVPSRRWLERRRYVRAGAFFSFTFVPSHDDDSGGCVSRVFDFGAVYRCRTRLHGSDAENRVNITQQIAAGRPGAYAKYTRVFFRRQRRKYLGPYGAHPTGIDYGRE